ncbi:hypothetical protein [Paraburkholderia sp. BL21I4N1]|uniref:hypothetical protein n=1 Tax=Paraburkholderia sp. BL21I4N1 TaxID=1938801 RepID=UPI000D4265F2|nr:hypothetical protein [Paraburkholderia sp. BL21I4N1]PQV54849.1 hypothetical protein B0G83_1011032 [Paraburkholderia sp. BL21I4N1]
MSMPPSPACFRLVQPGTRSLPPRLVRQFRRMLVHALPTMAGVVVPNFVLMKLVPGDAVLPGTPLFASVTVIVANMAVYLLRASR